MPRLLKKAEEHSHLLGYRWNPAKCIVVNPPLYPGRTSPLRLYGSPLPAADSFNYLGLPFNNKAQLDAGMLVQRNIQSALVTMRTSIQPLGFHSPSFSRLTAAKIYGTFIRPKLEYGLSISKLLVKHTKSLEKAQDICLRLLFRGKAAASTQVYKHLTALPHVHERVAILAFKTITRTAQLPSDTLLGSLLPHIESSRKDVKFRWPMLLTQSSLWKFICHPPGSDPDAAPAYTCIMDWLNSPTGNNAKAVISQFRHQNLTSTLNHHTPPVLLSSCRPRIGVDPILFLPMDNWLRSRICRWKMGWLPARPVPCQCGHPHASRQQLLSCLSVADRLNVSHDAQPNPLDYVLNQLPNIKKPPSTSSQHQQVYLRWSSWWPIVCQILFEMETICLPDEEFSLAASDTQGLAFLEWLLPVYYKQVAPIVRSSLKSTTNKANISTAPTFEFLPQTEVFKSTTSATKSHDELDHPVSTEPSTDTTSLDPFTQDNLTDKSVTKSYKRKHSLTTADSLPSKVIKMRNPKDKIPEKDILKKRITTTTTNPSSVKKSASGTSLLPKPTARNTATDKLQRTVEEANNNADQCCIQACILGYIHFLLKPPFTV